MNRFREYGTESIHTCRRPGMLELFVASDMSRRLIENSLEFDDGATRKTKKSVRRRRLRSVSAAALRGLAERLEPSPSA
jgi:hypothetical protein